MPEAICGSSGIGIIASSLLFVCDKSIAQYSSGISDLRNRFYETKLKIDCVKAYPQ
jgi:hypothetical protein